MCLYWYVYTDVSTILVRLNRCFYIVVSDQICLYWCMLKDMSILVCRNRCVYTAVSKQMCLSCVSKQMCLNWYV